MVWFSIVKIQENRCRPNETNVRTLKHETRTKNILYANIKQQQQQQKVRKNTEKPFKKQQIKTTRREYL